VKPVTRTIHITLLCLLTIALFACGGGGGTERFTTGIPIPPDAEAPVITPLVVQSDSLKSAGVKYYRIPNATAGDLYALEIFATRRDFESWDILTDHLTWANNNSIPLLRIYRPGTDPGTMDLYLEHDYSGALGGSLFSWDYYGWGKHDLDIPLFRIPQTGTYYIAVSTDNLGFGSVYSLRLQTVATPVDATALATDNTTPGNAIAVTGSTTIYDHYTSTVPAAPNYYRFNVSTPTIACFEVTAFRNGRFMGDTDYFDPTLVLYSGLNPTPAAILADGLDIDIDDYLFSDPKLCYKLTTAGDYLLEVNEAISTGSSDYFLTATINAGIGRLATGELAGGGGTANNTFGTADAIAYGDTVVEDVGASLDPEDWFTFTATPGDVLELQVFDGTNADDETNGVYVELFATNTAKPLRASAPAAATLPTKYSVTGPGAFTIRTILEADAAAGQAAPLAYYLKFTPQSPIPGPTNYTFSLNRLRAASFGAVDGFTVEQNVGSNNLPSAAPEDLDNNGYGAGILGVGDAADSFRFTPPAAGKLVTINVYAKAPASRKAHDLDGFGSTLQPIVTVYGGNATTELAKATYTAETLVSAEGIAAPTPTLTVSYLSPGGTDNYIQIASEPGSTTEYPAYFIEVVTEP